MMSYRSDELYHHGIKGQKWGVRRYQNPDGSLTDAGIKRYGEHGSDYLNAKRAYKTASRRAGRARRLYKFANIATKGTPLLNMAVTTGGSMARGSYERKEKEAKDNYTRAKYTRDYETGKRKALAGRYQPNVEDEIKYGRRESVRIAKRRNKGMTKEKAYRITHAKNAAKVIGKVSIGLLSAYDLATGGKVHKAVLKDGIKTGIKVAKAVSTGTKAAKTVYNNHYNTQILDASGKVVARYHEKADIGEIVAAGLLHG